MLENSEKIQGVDLKAVFTKMLAEVPWENLKAYVLANAQLAKSCTIGGFRLEPKQRKRIETFIMRDVEKGEFSELLCNGVFASWYPVHKELHLNLENYFHSDEYKAYREEHSIGEDEYVLPDEKFESFYNVQDFEAWRILLCFSPLKFTLDQAEKITADKKDDASMLERIKSAESERDELSKKVAQLTAEAERLRAKQQGDQTEWNEQRKQLRQLKSENEALAKRVETAVAEMRRANQQLAQAGAEAEQKEAAIRSELGRAAQRQQNENERLSKDVAAWQSRYEEQCSVNRALSDKVSSAERRCAEAVSARETAELKISDSQKLVDSILNRIDWSHVGASMKLTPTMKRNFNSLLKKLDYDEDRNLTLGAALDNFWGRMLDNEKALVEAISKSTERELINGTVKDYWQGLAGSFVEVQSTLEARMIMVGMLQDIFYQSYTDEELQEAKPKATKK